MRSPSSGSGRCAVSEADGHDHLIRSYLRGFGPAALEDVSSWSGVPARLLAPALERLRLRRFRDERDRELLDLPRAPLPPADTPAPVRFLPWWDAVLLVHARRTGILPEEYRPIVFDNKNPPSVPTFLVDGRVAGAWRYDDGRIELEPYERLSRRGAPRAPRGRRAARRVHERRRMSVTPSRRVSRTEITRSSLVTCSLKATISGREPSTARPPESVLSAAIRPRSEIRGNTAS